MPEKKIARITASIQKVGSVNMRRVVIPAAAIRAYLREYNPRLLAGLRGLHTYRTEAFMTRDGQTRRNLELLQTLTAWSDEMLKLEPVGRYLVNVCTDISCMLLGGAELLDGFHRLLWIASAVTATSGLLAFATIRNRSRAAPPSPRQYHCSTCSPPVAAERLAA